MKSGYVWFSYGSDTTGPVLAKALGFDSGKKTPDPAGYGIILGYGAKAGTTYKAPDFKRLVATGKLRLLNTVEAIATNRNKLKMLEHLRQSGVLTPGFVRRGKTNADVVKAINAGQVSMPLIGLNDMNKGEPQFVYTIDDLNKVSKEVNYFRTFLPGTEYRVHILRDTVLLIQVKTQTGDPVGEVAGKLKARLAKRAEKDQAARALTTLPDATLRLLLEEAAGDEIKGPNQLYRSVGQGWELTDVEIDAVPEVVRTEAVRALEVAGLDMGAVSVTLDSLNPHARPAVTVITTAPALSDKHLKIYAAAIKDFIAGSTRKETTPKVRKIENRPAPTELVAKLTKLVSDLPEKEANRLLKFLESD